MTCQCKPPRWADLTHDEQAAFGNGCGPAFFPDWLVHLLFGWFFDASCRRHDFGYARGGSRQDRLNVDKGFYRAMLRDADRVSGWAGYWLARLTALVFYYLVRGLGWVRFNYGPYQSLNKLVPSSYWNHL